MIRPLRNNVVLREVAPDEVSAGGLFLPAEAQEHSQRAIVVAAGPDADGLEEGDEVIYRHQIGLPIKVDGEELIMTSADHVLAVVQ